jgi:multidrug efflux pump subunit AcrA (membrane-fusion protein)
MNSPYSVRPASHPHPAQTQSAVRVATPTAAAVPVPLPNKLALLLKLEGEIRQQPNWAATVFHALNMARDIGGFQKAYFLRANNRQGFKTEAVSNVASVDAHAPFILALNSAASHIEKPNEVMTFNMAQVLKSRNYPHQNALWLPLKDQKSRVFAGFIFTRTDPWTEESKTIATRLAEAYGHALRVHRPPALLRQLSLPRWALIGIPILTLALAVIPVPLTTLAPFEVVPDQPVIVTSPVDGVLADILSEPSTMVSEGDTLIRFDTTELQSQLDVSVQKVMVATSKLATARNGAFSDNDMKRSMAELEKEFDLAMAEQNYAAQRLARATVTAAKSGLLIYSNKSDWSGKPLRVGEKIMEIADPEKVQFRIDLGVHDSIALAGDASVRLFFDADPLRPLNAKVVEKSYHATEQPGGILAYTLKAKLNNANDAMPRIGLRGTAQLTGENVPLGFYLLRRPIAAFRQYFGL